MLIILIISIFILVVPGIFAINFSYYDPLFPKGMKGVLSAMPMLFFSYAGFESLAQVAGETKNPTKTLPEIFVKGVLAKAGDVIDASENDANLLIGMRKAIASTKSISAEDVKKPENKAVKRKSIFSRKKK